MKGKHGQSAATRQAIQTRDGEIATYRNAVARLTRERDDARQLLRDEQQRHRRAERELRARLENEAAPKVEALQILLGARQDDLRAAKAAVREESAKLGRVTVGWARHMMREHGLTQPDAIRLIGEVIGMKSGGKLEVAAANAGADEDDPERARAAQWDHAIERRDERSIRTRSVVPADSAHGYANSQGVL